jgi:hypothetical protein
VRNNLFRFIDFSVFDVRQDIETGEGHGIAQDVDSQRAEIGHI